MSYLEAKKPKKGCKKAKKKRPNNYKQKGITNTRTRYTTCGGDKVQNDKRQTTNDKTTTNMKKTNKLCGVGGNYTTNNVKVMNSKQAGKQTDRQGVCVCDKDPNKNNNITSSLLA
ncbi:hypothetical protein ACJQWK_09993 [Exserohilum turcicum]